MKVKRFLKEFVFANYRVIIFTTIYLLTLNIAVLINPYLLKEIVDKGLNDLNLTHLITYVSIAIVLNILLEHAGYYKTIVIEKFSSGVYAKVQYTFFKNYLFKDLAFFKETKMGDLIKRVNIEVSEVKSFLSSVIPGFLSTTISFIAIFLYLLYYNLLLAFITLFFVVLKYLVYRNLHKNWNTEEMLEDKGKVAEFEYEVISGIKIIKETNSLKSILKKYLALLNQFKLTFLDYEKSLSTFFIQVGFVDGIGELILLAFGGYLTYINSLTIGEFMGFYYISRKLGGYVSELANQGVSFDRFKASINRIYEYLDVEEKVINQKDPIEVKKVAGEIEFKNISFSYEDNIEVIKDLSFRINPKETIGIVGYSGQGKSTIIDLLFRFYDVKAGEILLDSIDIRTFDIDSYRSKIGVISQEVHLFNDTLRNNIKFYNEVSDEKMIEVCKQVNINDFIETLPNKYDTFVGERGLKLSGGQKQRIAIARTILRDPEIIIFDEATSHLDTLNERIIQNYIKEFSKDKTTIIIAHRLSTIIDCDRILVLNSGNIENEGKHDELLTKSRIYKKLWKNQSNSIND